MKPMDFSISLNDAEVVGFDLNLNLERVGRLFPNSLITKKIVCIPALQQARRQCCCPHFVDSDIGAERGGETRWVSGGK